MQIFNKGEVTVDKNENFYQNAEVVPTATRYMGLYGININLQRSIPDVYDGLKLIHRRIIYTLYKNYPKFGKATVAMAAGQTLKYSPHGDLGLKDIFAGLSQPFSNNIPLLTALGNCGTATNGYDAAAGRYWAVKISEFTYDVLLDEFDGKVDMKPNYDSSTVEPIRFPAKFPIVLLNGSMGIGYTLSSDIYPYNLNEIADATIKLLKNPKANIRLVPDSPTGCDIIIKDDESFWFQSSYEIDNVNYVITFRNTPYKEFLTDIQKKLNEIQDSPNPIPEILHADNESDLVKGEIRFVIKCVPCNLYQVLNTLFKRVDGLRSSISTRNMIVVDGGSTFKYDVKQILLAWIRTRIQSKRSWFLRKSVTLKTEINMLEGKMFMLSPANLQKTINCIKSCKTKGDIVDSLVKLYKGQVSTSQAKYMMDVKMYQLTHEEFLKTKDRIDELTTELEQVLTIVKDPIKINDVIINELTAIKHKYGYPRRSKIINGDNTSATNIGIVQILPTGAFIFTETENPEHLSSDVIPINGDDICLIDDKGQFIWVNVNKVPHNTQLTMTSIGKGQMGKCVAAVSNENNKIVVLTNHGRIKYMPISKIPKNSRGLTSVVPLDSDEYVVSIIEAFDESNDILVYTTDGYGKRFNLSELNVVLSITAQGQFLIKDHETAGMFMLNPKKPLLLYVTRLGRLRINESRFLINGKKFGNIQPIIKLSQQDDLIAVFCVDKDQTVTLNHVDSRVTSVHIDTIEPTTMNMPPVRPKHVPGVKVIRASIS